MTFVAHRKKNCSLSHQLFQCLISNVFFFLLITFQWVLSNGIFGVLNLWSIQLRIKKCQPHLNHFTLFFRVAIMKFSLNGFIYQWQKYWTNDQLTCGQIVKIDDIYNTKSMSNASTISQFVRKVQPSSIGKRKVFYFIISLIKIISESSPQYN